MSESAQDLITLTGGGRGRIGSLPWTGSSTTSRHHYCLGWIKFPLASFSFAGQKPQLSSAHLWGLFLINISHVLKSTIFSDRKLPGEPEERGRTRHATQWTVLHGAALNVHIFFFTSRAPYPSYPGIPDPYAISIFSHCEKLKEGECNYFCATLAPTSRCPPCQRIWMQCRASGDHWWS